MYDLDAIVDSFIGLVVNLMRKTLYDLHLTVYS